MFFFLPARLSVSFLTQIQAQWEKKTTERRRRGEKKRNDREVEDSRREEEKKTRAELLSEEGKPQKKSQPALHSDCRCRSAVRGNQRFCSLSDRKQKLCCRLESQIFTQRYFVTETTESKRKIKRTSSDNEETFTPCSPRGLGLKVVRVWGLTCCCRLSWAVTDI